MLDALHNNIVLYVAVPVVASVVGIIARLVTAELLRVPLTRELWSSWVELMTAAAITLLFRASELADDLVAAAGDQKRVSELQNLIWDDLGVMLCVFTCLAACLICGAMRRRGTAEDWIWGYVFPHVAAVVALWQSFEFASRRV